MKCCNRLLLFAFLLLSNRSSAQVDSIEQLAKHMVQEILETMGKEPDLIKTEASKMTDYVKAVKDNGVRIILFNPGFLSDFGKKESSGQRILFLMAHEVGHHLNNDDFSSNDIAVRKQMEINADSFAGIILYRFCIDPQKVYALMEGLPVAERGPYASKSLRMYYIMKGYEKEREISVERKIDPCQGKIMDPPMNLQWRYNKKNKVESVSTRIFHDSILISYKIRIPENYHKGFDKRFAVYKYTKPEMKIEHFRWLNEPRSEETLRAVWYYKKDKFSYRDVFKPDHFGIVVFKHGMEPKMPEKWRWWLGGILAAGGTALLVSGIPDHISAKKDYDQYRTITNPDLFFNVTGTTRQEAFARFNPVKKRSEWCILYGLISFGAGARYLIQNNERRRHFLKDVILFPGQAP